LHRVLFFFFFFLPFCPAYNALHGNDFPVLSFVWWILVCAAIVSGKRKSGKNRRESSTPQKSQALLIQNKPWKSSSGLARITTSDRAVIVLYGALIALNITFLCEGVKYYGALRAAMTVDYSDLPIVYLIGSFLGRFSICTSGACGTGVVCCSRRRRRRSRR
jgi:hypothetical protein